MNKNISKETSSPLLTQRIKTCVINEVFGEVSVQGLLREQGDVGVKVTGTGDPPNVKITRDKVLGVFQHPKIPRVEVKTLVFLDGYLVSVHAEEGCKIV